jgi:hypothetical protein
MGTTYSKSFVEAIIASGGKVSGRPPVVKIVKYENQAGHTRWGVVYAGDGSPDRYEKPNKLRMNAQVMWVNDSYDGQQTSIESAVDAPDAEDGEEDEPEGQPSEEPEDEPSEDKPSEEPAPELQEAQA